MSNGHPKTEEGWKFKRNRDGDTHEKNCREGYCRTLTLLDATAKGGERRVAEIHHILCVHACSDATFPSDIQQDEMQFIRELLSITDWDINGPMNNIGLPRKWAYVLDSRNGTNWDGLPCHQVDHDIYLDKVEEWVTENIWNKIKKNRKLKKCERTTGPIIKNMFDVGSRSWKRLLKARGEDYGGTKRGLDYCHSGSNDPAKENVWHIPFSMAFPESDVRRRAKPPAGIPKRIRDVLAIIR